MYWFYDVISGKMYQDENADRLIEYAQHCNVTDTYIYEGYPRADFSSFGSSRFFYIF